MTLNKSSNPPSGPNKIRPLFWGAILLLVAAGIATAVFFHGNKKPPQETPSVATASSPSENQVQPAPAVASSTLIPSQAAVLSVATNQPDSDPSRLIAALSNDSLSLKARCDAARALAKLGNQAAMTALKNALAGNSPPYLKAGIAEALGQCPNPEARGLLNDLAHGSDEITARGAVRGLALRGDADAMNALGELLFSSQTPVGIRAEAATSLGDVNLPGSHSLLMRAMTEIKDETVVENVLGGLAKRPIADTQTFFNNYLSGDASVESKVTAVEALGNASDATPFLLNYLNNPSTEIRAAVAWSLITAESETDISPQLMGALKQESDPGVRTRLYQALENQSAVNAMVMLPLVQNETAPAARLAGFDYLAGTLQSSPAPEVQAYFNQTAVPELQRTALDGGDMQTRLAAVQALDRARTPQAIAALQTIVQKSTDQKVISAVRLP